MKLRPSNLVKFLQSIRQPLYLIDETATLFFCNRALEEWTGCDAEKLIGERLRYRVPGSRLKHEIIAASLAPPPEVFEGKRRRTLLTIDHITSLSRRFADFIPFSPKGILVLVEDSEASATTAPVDHEESRQRQEASDLHQALFSIRRRQAGRFRWDRMIGSTPTMQRIRRLARLAVDSTASVLILGEVGTGKEHLASAIHYGQTSSDQAGALVPIDCRALPQELIASTILAFRKRYQREELGRRHTLLLKDVDMFPTELVPLVADFVAAAPGNQRIIATSPLPIDAWSNGTAQKSGNGSNKTRSANPSFKTKIDFLPNLLGTILIELPPLREREEDIPLLVQMFLEERNEIPGRQRAGYTADALDLLIQYDWPNNIDELERAVEEAFGKSAGTLIAASDLPIRLHDVFDAAAEKRSELEPIELESFLQNIERELIERAVRMARGNKSKAAELLGMTRPKLYRRLESLGLLENDGTAESISFEPEPS